jgi:hypothetical protein
MTENFLPTLGTDGEIIGTRLILGATKGASNAPFRARRSTRITPPSAPQ